MLRETVTMHGEQLGTVLCSSQCSDGEGNPAGGYSEGMGIAIRWQDGPTGVIDRNGAFVEDVLILARERLNFYQKSKYQCAENEAAISHIDGAIATLRQRTKNRKERGVEGQNVV